MTTLQTSNQQPESQNPLWTGVSWLIPPLIFLLIWLGIPYLAPAAPLTWLTSSKAAWYLTRASGIVGYLLLSLSMMWGLLLSGKLVKKRIPPATALAMHNYLSWTAIGLSVFHAAILLFDNYYSFNLFNLLVPFTGPYAPFWVGLGIIGLYIMLVTSVSWFWRKKIGQKQWRKLHFLTFLAYIFVTLHGLMAGTDAVLLAAMYSVSSIGVLFLTFYRILTAINKT